jgi:chemotaxis protein MotB
MREPVAGDNPSEDEKDPEQSGSFSYLDPPPGKFTSRYANIERRITGETAFPADELSFSSMPRPTHWSVAWSDLMMTMFILFLCLFVYKSANEDFLGEKKPEIIGGDTTEALQSMDLGQTNLPIVPLKKLPLMTAGTIKKVVKIPTSEPPPETNIKETPAPPGPALPGMPKDLTEFDNSFDDNVQPAQQEMGNETMEPRAEPQPSTKQKEPEGQPPTEIGATDQSTVSPPATKQDTFTEIYKLSKETLEQKGVASLADVELVPDKTMRTPEQAEILMKD